MILTIACQIFGDMFPKNILLPMSLLCSVLRNGGLVCNYVSRLAEPITSCSTKFSLKSLQEKEVVKTIIEISGSHINRTITTLQSCYRLMCIRHRISKTYMFHMCGVSKHSFSNYLQKTAFTITYMKCLYGLQDDGSEYLYIIWIWFILLY
uniref:Uncharacterized protein n=1 Tax=Glossina pallidipes TaxID=7398 RepID=A0A1A9ZNR0_GLOPL